MSVYTTVSHDELAAFLAGYPLGGLVDFEGISAGIENTNYFVNTEDGHWVLTLFERQDESVLPYFLGLMDHLARRGIPSASPAENKAGEMLTQLNGKPAALVHRLDGGNEMSPGPAHCAELGTVLAEAHLAASSYPDTREPDHGSAWCRERAAAVNHRLSEEDRELLEEELSLQNSLAERNLPEGVIHADLFRDNVLFSGERLTGLIDFYYACNDILLYDLAVVVNDWCFVEGDIDMRLYHALTDSYANVRGFNDEERQAWNAALRSAALRFWLSRLVDFHFPRDGELTHTKDPGEFRGRLDWHRQHADLKLP